MRYRFHALSLEQYILFYKQCFGEQALPEGMLTKIQLLFVQLCLGVKILRFAYPFQYTRSLT